MNQNQQGPWGAAPAEPPLPAFDPADIRRVGRELVLPRPLAERHPSFGAGGVLAILALIIVASLVLALPRLILVWAVLEGGATQQQWIAAGHTVASFALFITALWLMWDLKSAFPAFMAATCVAAAGIAILRAVNGTNPPAMAAEAVLFAVFLVYVATAAKVRVTYLGRVRLDDPFVRRIFPTGVPPRLMPAPPFPRNGV